MKTKTKYWANITVGIASLAGHASAASLGSEKYSYDKAGNVVVKQIGEHVTRFTYEGIILKSDDHGSKYHHDDAGRLIEESSKEGVQRKFTYQYDDKVTKVEKGGKTTELFYNAEGQLVGKKSSERSENFAWDSLALVLSGVRAFSNEDHAVGGVPVLIGDDVAVCDGVGTTLSVGAKRFESLSSGEALKEGLFTGKPFVEELDSFVFKHRNYSAVNCRWSTADPSGFPDGPNNYLYACNNAVTNVDPTGLMTLGNPAPSPTTKNQPSPGNLKVTAYDAAMRDNRSIAKGLIETKINPTLPAGDRYTVSLTSAGPPGTINFSPYRAAYGSGGGAPESNTAAGGCYISIGYTGVPLDPAYTEESIQVVFSNEPGSGAHAAKDTSYLDNHGNNIPFYGGVYDSSTNIMDNPSRDWKKDTHWTADVHYVTYLHSTKKIFMPPDSSFKYSWNMKEQ